MYAGFVTTGLELWAALPCGSKHFRQRLWGTLNMPGASLMLLHRVSAAAAANTCMHEQLRCRSQLLPCRRFAVCIAYAADVCSDSR